MMAVGVGEGDGVVVGPCAGIVVGGDGEEDRDGDGDGLGVDVAGSVVDCLIQSGGVPVCPTGQES